MEYNAEQYELTVSSKSKQATIGVFDKVVVEISVEKVCCLLVLLLDARHLLTRLHRTRTRSEAGSRWLWSSPSIAVIYSNVIFTFDNIPKIYIFSMPLVLARVHGAVPECDL